MVELFYSSSRVEQDFSIVKWLLRMRGRLSEQGQCDLVGIKSWDRLHGTPSTKSAIIRGAALNWKTLYGNIRIRRHPRLHGYRSRLQRGGETSIRRKHAQEIDDLMAEHNKRYSVSEIITQTSSAVSSSSWSEKKHQGT